MCAQSYRNRRWTTPSESDESVSPGTILINILDGHELKVTEIRKKKSGSPYGPVKILAVNTATGEVVILTRQALKEYRVVYENRQEWESRRLYKQLPCESISSSKATDLQVKCGVDSVRKGTFVFRKFHGDRYKVLGFVPAGKTGDVEIIMFSIASGLRVIVGRRELDANFDVDLMSRPPEGGDDVARDRSNGDWRDNDTMD